MIIRKKPDELEKQTAKSIHHAAYRPLVEMIFGAWDDQAQDAFFESDWRSATFDVLYVRDQLVGYLGYRTSDVEFYIAEIVIDPTHQNQGLGSQLLSSIINESLLANRMIRLQVLHQNRALSLYQRLGFVEYDQTESHILMQYQLS